VDGRVALLNDTQAQCVNRNEYPCTGIQSEKNDAGNGCERIDIGHDGLRVVIPLKSSVKPCKQPLLLTKSLSMR
jgi:hypothetical protein